MKYQNDTMEKIKFHKYKIFYPKRYLIIIVFVIYFFWSYWDRNFTLNTYEPRLDNNHILLLGNDKTKNSLIGIQPWMESYDYRNEESFYRKLNYYFRISKDKNLLKEHSIVVLPEYIGTWLVTLNEKKTIYDAESITTAMTIMILSNLPKFLWNLLKSKSEDKIKDTIFRMKAEKMAITYQNVFSRLAKEYKTTLVAGSILLPSPEIINGKIIVGNGELENVTAVFSPSGEIISPLVRKIYTIQEEKSFVKHASLEMLPVFSTPLGTLGVLICADSWYPDVYKKFRENNVEIIAVPSYIAGQNTWEKPWNGYSGWAMPEDVDPKDVLSLTEGEAWIKYSLIGRIFQSKAKIGMNVFLRGNLWDLGSDGKSIIVFQNRSYFGPDIEGASIVVVAWDAKL